MKLMIFAGIGLAVGLMTGTGVTAVRVKDHVETTRMQAVADSLGALAAMEEGEPVSDTLPSPDDNAVPEPGVDGDAGAGGVGEAMPPGGREASGEAQAPGGQEEEGEPENPAEPRDVDDVGAASAWSPLPDMEGLEKVEGIEVSATGARRLAKVFGAMKADDAAPVLAQLSDLEVQAILVELGDRQAGQILRAFPVDRAARLSRLVLGQATAGGDR